MRWLLDFSEELVRAANVRSAEEVARFLFASYVKKSIGRYCDRSVSGIIGEVLGPPDHNEVAQRMWRHRNSERLEKSLSGVTEILFAFGSVINGQNVTQS